MYRFDGICHLNETFPFGLWQLNKFELLKKLCYRFLPGINHLLNLCSLSQSKEPSQQRVKRWGFSFDEILKDQVGRDQFLRFLESEFSSENLRYISPRFELCAEYLKKFTSSVSLATSLSQSNAMVQIQIPINVAKVGEQTLCSSFIITGWAPTNTTVFGSLNPDDMCSSYWKHIFNNKSMVEWI